MMLGWSKKVISHLDNTSTGTMPTVKRKKKSIVQKETKRTKAVSTTSEFALTHSTETDGYSACDLLNRWNSIGPRYLYNEFTKLSSEKSSGLYSVSLSRENAPRNRYTDILCLDQSRVRLGSEPECSQTSDYINANFVDGYNQKKAYIATQGPLYNTCEDFWQMVWEQNILVIVMTTWVVEKGHHKCAQYWPKHCGKTLSWKNFSVVNKSVNVIEHFIETELLLRKNETITQTGEERSVIHLFFTTWPDHGVPSSATELLSFMFHVRRKQKDQIAKLNSASDSPSVHPVLVHCSAGIGRTGTFITVDICTRSVADTGRLDILKVVQKIRSQRAFSVQTVDQYIFCHKALVEYCQTQGYGKNQSEDKNSATLNNSTALEVNPIGTD